MAEEPGARLDPRRNGARSKGAAERAPEPTLPALDRGEEAFPLLRVLDDEGGAAREVGLSGEALLSLYHAMLLSRQLDERMTALQRQGRDRLLRGSHRRGGGGARLGARHGAERLGLPSYREHAVALVRGMPLATFVCDLLGNAGDVMLGHQMPCHEAWRPAPSPPSARPSGPRGRLPRWRLAAAGEKGDDMVPLVYVGDGATSSNDFHSGLNFAGVHRIPVVVVCRNNGWAISLPRERQTASATIAQKALAYGIAGERVDGNDLLAVYEATARARRAAAGAGPPCSSSSPTGWRATPPPTIDAPTGRRSCRALARQGPILRLRRHLARRGLLGPEEDGRLHAEVRNSLQEAVKAAEALPPKPRSSTLFEGYAEPQWQQREQLTELRDAVASDPRVGDPRARRR